ncbi:MAG: protein-L-isoaspartate(D-aspartate) O-methyltransferase [Ignavibacteriae bacterium]|nr:protein-L-isoaspartate(D-aspartate) O-methyltransferase [Ignavibacteriota bacterium]
MTKAGINRFRSEREEMLELLKQRGIKNEQLLHAMFTVERHRFVDLPFVNRSYEDCALPIGNEQTISQPYTVAVMTELLEVKKGDKILEIGTGSGYQAAILAEMGARVFTIERHAHLLNEARHRLEKLGYEIVSKVGDGTLGWSEFAPFQGIIVTAAAPEVPDTLLKQLDEGGNLVIPVGEINTQDLWIVKRRGQNFSTRKIIGFKFVPLIGKKGWK